MDVRALERAQVRTMRALVRRDGKTMIIAGGIVLLSESPLRFAPRYTDLMYSGCVYVPLILPGNW